MPKVQGYTTQGQSWSKVNAAKGQKTGTGHGDHAETKAYTGMGTRLSNNNVYLYVQDAFPCSGSTTSPGCHQRYLQRSQNGQAFVVKVDENGGSYSFDHGLGASPTLPVYIYYHGGGVSYAQGAPNRPANFPAHPDPSNAVVGF